jgi:hypothetical protein
MPVAFVPVLPPEVEEFRSEEIVLPRLEPDVVFVRLLFVIGVINGPAKDIGLDGPPLTTQSTKKNTTTSVKKRPSLMGISYQLLS